MSVGELLFSAFAIYAVSGLLFLFVPAKQHAFALLAWGLNTLGSIVLGVASLYVILHRTAVHVQWAILPTLPIELTVHAGNAYFLFIMCVIAAPVSIYAIGYYKEEPRIRLHGLLIVLFLLSLSAVFTASNGLTFLIAWEAMSLFSFGLVLHDHDKPQVRRAGFIYMVMTHLASLFLFIGFLFLYNWTGSFDFSVWSAAAAHFSWWQKNLIFVFAVIAFGTKAGIAPLHIWLPRAHPAAPSPVSALMSGLMVKAGLFGLMQVVMMWFHGGLLWWGIFILGIGMITGVLGALYSVVQDDLKQLLAYSTVENIGLLLMLFGMYLISQTLGLHTSAVIAGAGFMLHLVNHAVFKSMLFLGAGAVQHAAGTVQMNRLGGLARQMPFFSILFLVGAAAAAGVPFFGGFIGDWLGFQAIISTILEWSSPLKGLGVMALAALAFISALAAAAMVKSYGSIFLAKPRSVEAQHIHKPHKAMAAAMLFLGGAAIIGGLFPVYIWKLLFPAAQYWMPAASLQIPGLMEWSVQDAEPHPLSASSSSTSSLGALNLLVLAFAFFIVLLIVSFAIRALFGSSRTVRGETWGCGHTLDESMEYSPSSLTFPIIMFFRWFYHPRTHVEKTRAVHGQAAIQVAFAVQIRRWIEQEIYIPLLQLIITGAKGIRGKQSGRIQVYIGFIFVTLMILLIVFTQW